MDINERLSMIDGVTVTDVPLNMTLVTINGHKICTFKYYDNGTFIIFPHHKYFSSTKLIMLDNTSELIGLINVKKGEIENDFTKCI